MAALLPTPAPRAVWALFSGWEEPMILSCLQGHMGSLTGDVPDSPRSACAAIGDFCFLAGAPSPDLAAAAAAPILVPRTPGWQAVIESVWGERVRPHTRYATRKDLHNFDPSRLAALAVPPAGFTLAPIDLDAYTLLGQVAWSKDLRGQFRDGADFCRRGLGVAAWHDGAIAAGASSYAIFDGGMEIEIDTCPDFRRLGLATACGAALVLACLERGLYPSWDAHTSISLALAEKLGYRSAGPYPVYLRR